MALDTSQGIDWNPLSWWETGLKDVLNIPGDLTDAATSWFSGIGGDIASGLEAAAVSFFGDLWNVISGPLYVIIGAIILVLTLGFAFKNQIIQIGSIAAAVG
jgi:hypothetical protein